MDTKQPSLGKRLVGIGVPKSYAYQLAAGKRTPSLEKAKEIERELGIPLDAWPMPEKVRAA